MEEKVVQMEKESEKKVAQTEKELIPRNNTAVLNSLRVH